MADTGREQWDNNARAFADLIDNQGTPHHRFILNPCVEALIGDVRGKSMLDAGCGEGYLSRHYAEMGAKVTGIDISRNLIGRAEALTKPGLDITYQAGDICGMSEVPDETFDLVLCNLVLLNVPCLRAALSGFYRVLRRGGNLVLSVVHPAFDFYGPGTWQMGEKNQDTGRREGLYFKMDRYTDEIEYKRQWRTRGGEEFPEPFSFYHRTLSTYVTDLLGVGFRLAALHEPLPPAENDFFDRERRIPFFLVMKAVKD